MVGETRVITRIVGQLDEVRVDKNLGYYYVGAMQKSSVIKITYIVLVVFTLEKGLQILTLLLN